MRETRIHAQREDLWHRMTLGCRSVGENRDDKTKIERSRDQGVDPGNEISRRGYLSHTWAGLLATALLFRSLAGLSIQFVVRAFLIGQTLIRRRTVWVRMIRVAITWVHISFCAPQRAIPRTRDCDSQKRAFLPCSSSLSLSYSEVLFFRYIICDACALRYSSADCGSCTWVLLCGPFLSSASSRPRFLHYINLDH